MNYGRILMNIRFVVILGIAAIFVMYNHVRPRILILHSYAPTNENVRIFKTTLKHTLGTNTYPRIKNHYLDLEGNISARTLVSRSHFAKEDIVQFHPQILITVGSQGIKHVTHNLKDAPITHITVSSHPLASPGFMPGTNTTAILKEGIAHHVLALIIGAYPHLPFVRIAVLGNLSHRGRAFERDIANLPTTRGVLTDAALVTNFHDWQKVVTHANQHADVLIVSSFDELHESVELKKMSDAETIIRWTAKHTTIPIITLQQDGARYGADLSMSPLVSEISRQAIEEAAAFISAPSRKHRIIKISDYMVGINHTRLKKTNFAIPQGLISLAKSHNRYFDAQTERPRNNR
ncbi:MAG: hypothetical protein H6849_04380 [Alphaproteobacteria bacterium]|nr:MAG: hypothetical protein H6849_04380 [Alphaproteobacteria bacterium]